MEVSYLRFPFSSSLIVSDIQAIQLERAYEAV